MILKATPQDLFYQQMGSIKNIHFVGIGGVGMCGIAEVMANLGYCVSGSDLHDTSITKHLRGFGINIYYGHKASNIDNADVVVVSSAIGLDNPEILAAKTQLIPIISRAEMLGELMRFRYGIAVSGTHGKTTTTSMISCILQEANLDPTYVIGGRLNGGSNARLGQGKFMVVEADESDVSFLNLKPMVSVVTNIDEDHMESYDGCYEKLQASFLKFLKLLPFYGKAVLCIDDPTVKKLLPQIPCKTLTYGFDEKADLRAVDCKFVDGNNVFTVLRHDKEPLQITLGIPGKHNVLNAMAAIGAVSRCDVSDSVIVAALKKFTGVKRRFDIKGTYQVDSAQFTMLDDYGHHPAEIDANINAIKEKWPHKRIVMLFQPHRYTRLKALFDDFVRTLKRVDVVLLLDVYSAGEAPIAGADSYNLQKSLVKEGVVTTILRDDDYTKEVLPHINHEDLLVTQGAGSIGNISKILHDAFSNY